MTLSSQSFGAVSSKLMVASLSDQPSKVLNFRSPLRTQPPDTQKPLKNLKFLKIRENSYLIGSSNFKNLGSPPTTYLWFTSTSQPTSKRLTTTTSCSLYASMQRRISLLTTMTFLPSLWNFLLLPRLFPRSRYLILTRTWRKKRREMWSEAFNQWQLTGQFVLLDLSPAILYSIDWQMKQEMFLLTYRDQPLPFPTLMNSIKLSKDFLPALTLTSASN